MERLFVGLLLVLDSAERARRVEALCDSHLALLSKMHIRQVFGNQRCNTAIHTEIFGNRSKARKSIHDLINILPCLLPFGVVHFPLI